MSDRRVLSFQPESGFYHKRAIKYVDKEDFTTALKNLRKAVEMEPENLEYRLDLADLYARMGLYERSNLEIQLMFHQPGLPSEALYGMASNFLSMGDYDQAEMMYRAYLQADPEGEYGGQAEEMLGYIAECDYETPLDRELDELSMDGKAALDAGDLEHAIDCLQRALEKDPSMTYVRNNLAVAYYCMGDMDRAWEQLDRVLEAAPLDVHGRCNESMFYLAAGERDKAVRAVRRLRLDRIEELDELFKYCLTLADARLDEELAQALKKIFLLSPYDTSMLFLWGVCQYNQEKYQESLRAFEKISIIDSGSLLAVDGLRCASAALREGRPPVERLEYTYDLTKEQRAQVKRKLHDLAKLSGEQLNKALEDKETRILVRAALSGSVSDMAADEAMLILSICKDSPIAERLMREIMLSPTQTSIFKQAAVETLHNLGAAEPYYALCDGKLTLVRSVRSEKEVKLPKGYVNVLQLAMEHMSERYEDMEATRYALALWSNYALVLDGKYPRLVNERSWVAALEALYLEHIGDAPDWERLAEESGASQRVIKEHCKRISEVPPYVEHFQH